MLFNFLSLFLSTFGVVFAVLDPFGFLPVFLSMTAGDTPERRTWMVRRACVFSFCVLTFFTLAGKYFLAFFGISIPALQIAGGLVLLTIAFEMLKVSPVQEKLSPEEESAATAKADISIIPLAIPMLAGPASLATVVVLSSKASSFIEYAVVLISIALTLLFTYLILSSAQRVLFKVSQTGLNVMTRVMGLLLSAMAVQFVINGYQAVSK